MRISALKYDPSFHPRAHECTAYLNGKKLKGCVTADDDIGEAICYEIDDNGNFFIDPNKPDEIKRVVLKGNVRIVVPFGFR